MEVTFEFPGLPPSVNNMYIAGRRRGTRFKSPKAKEWDEMVKGIVSHAEFFPVGLLSMEITLYASWFTKASTEDKKVIRKMDLSNRIKAVEDSVMSCLELDDSIVFEIFAHKVDSSEEKTVIRLLAIDEH